MKITTKKPENYKTYEPKDVPLFEFAMLDREDAEKTVYLRIPGGVPGQTWFVGFQEGWRQCHHTVYDGALGKMRLVDIHEIVVGGICR